MSSAQLRSNRFRAPQARLPPAPQGKRIIGIDLATTRCCVASAGTSWDQLEHIHDKNVRPHVEVYSSWAGTFEAAQRDPLTALYFEEAKRLPITGHALVPILKPIRKTGETSFNTERFFRLWKLMFHDNQNDPATKEIQLDIQRKLDQLDMTTDGLLRGWVAVTYAELLVKGINGQTRFNHNSDDRTMDLEIVVAVPPGRSVIAHEQVLQAFIQGPIAAHQVSLVSEPEAMFRSWVADGVDIQDWKVGNTYLVCDGGGGTCCFVRFRLDRLEPLSFSQESESESVVCGAETISNDFEKLAGTVVPPNVPNRPWVLDNLRCQFDDYYKRTFGLPGYEHREYSFQQPWDRNAEIVFSCGQIAACFNHCVSKLLAGIQHQLQRGRSARQLSSSTDSTSPLPQQPADPFYRNESPAATSTSHCRSSAVEYLVLGGGLFGNPYVMRKIRDAFPSLTIRDLSADKSNVARGAVLTRLHARNDFISSRPIMRSKALVTWIPIEPAISSSPLYPLLDKWTDTRNGVEYFYAAQWLAKQGDEAVLRHANDFYEIASESSYETARNRAFSLKTKNLEFSEKILTVNYHPGDAKWAAFRQGDNKLIDQNGNLIPDYEESETITWDPQKFGVSVGGLEVRSRGKLRYKVLRYSFQMQLREVGTKYWIKAWYKNKKQITAVLSEATERQALFQSQEISHNLSESRKLGSGIRSEDDPSDDHDFPMGSQELNHQNSPSLQHIASPIRPDAIIAQAQTAGNVPSPSTAAGFRPPSLVSYPENLEGDSFPATSARFTLSSNPGKRSASADGARQPFRAFSRSPLHIRPTQRQSIESNSEYSLGVPRNNGGCWTCAFRNLRCEQGKPKCPQCSRVGVVCEYGRPIWWYDEKLKEEQKDINKQLIKDHKARLSFKGRLSAKSLTPRAKISSSSFKSVNRFPRLGVPVGVPQIDAQHAGSFQPPVAVNIEAQRVSSTLPKTYNSSSLLERAEQNLPHSQDEDIYGTSPPRRQQSQRNAENKSRVDSVRRSTRPRVHIIPNDMKLWDDVDEEEFGIQSESESRTEESNEEYVAEDD